MALIRVKGLLFPICKGVLRYLKRLIGHVPMILHHIVIFTMLLCRFNNLVRTIKYWLNNLLPSIAVSGSV